MAAATEANANTCEKRKKKHFRILFKRVLVEIIYFKRLYMQTEYNVSLL